jgi:ABC-type uncharacterized transport system substrate-binding protein
MKTLFNRINLFSLKLARVSLTLLFFAFPSIAFAEETHNILIIISSNSNTYETTASNIKTTLRNNNARSTNIKIITIEEYFTHYRSLTKTIDIIVPIGQRALKETLKYSGNVPVLSSLISKYDFDRIISNRGQTGNNIGAIYIDQPLDRHLLFSKLVLPNVNRFSFIINSGNKYYIDKLNSLDEESHRIDMLNHGDNVIATLSYALKDADAIIAIPDPIIFNLRTTRNILLSSYRKRVPIIGISKSHVKAGALAAIYSTPESIGKQTGEVITLFIKRASSNSDPFFLPRLHAKYFSISVNKRVSRSLGLSINNEDSLRKDLLKIEKSRPE